MADRCDEIADRFDDQVVTKPEFKFWREAANASAFASLIGARLVRLHDGERPDFAVNRDGLWEQFELTEALQPGRRRGDEYKAPDHNSSKFDPYNDWVRRRQAIPEALKASIHRKTSRIYQDGCNLLIYLNLGTYGHWREDIEADIQRECAPALKQFKQVWVLWDGSAIEVSSGSDG